MGRETRPRELAQEALVRRDEDVADTQGQRQIIAIVDRMHQREAEVEGLVVEFRDGNERVDGSANLIMCATRLFF